MTFDIHRGLFLSLGLFDWRQLGDDPCLEMLERDSLDGVED